MAHRDRGPGAHVHGALQLRERDRRHGGADVGDVEEIADLSAERGLGDRAGEQPIDHRGDETLGRLVRAVLIEDAAPREARVGDGRVGLEHLVEGELARRVEEARARRARFGQLRGRARVVLEAGAEADETRASCIDQRGGELEAGRDVGEVLRRVQVLAGHRVPGGVDAHVGLGQRNDAGARGGIEEIGLVPREQLGDAVEPGSMSGAAHHRMHLGAAREQRARDVRPDEAAGAGQ